MKRILHSTAALLLLLACAGCIQPFSVATRSSDPQHPHTDATSETPAHGAIVDASAPQDCSTLANKRLAMYDKPDTFPVSAQEKQDAYNALYIECTHGQNMQVAAASHNNVAANNVTAAEFANLSPAAGGNYPATGTNVVSAGGNVISSSQVPGATVVVIGGAGNNNAATAAQLSSLSPSSGGNYNPGNATVVMVQSPQAVPTGYYPGTRPPSSYYTPGAPLPVAVPVAPQAAAVKAPASTTASYQPSTTPAAAPAPQAVASKAPAPQAVASKAPAPQAAIRAPRETLAPQPSLASASADATGNASSSSASEDAATRQLENVLEK